MKNLDRGTLSDLETLHFRTQGYFKLDQVFSMDETAEMREFVHKQAALELNQPAPPEGRTAKMYRLFERDPDFMTKVIGHPSLIGPLTSILGPNIIFLKNRHNHAALNNVAGGPGEGLHRDILQPTRSIVTAAIYLQDASEPNGATRVIPGSHLTFPYVGVPEETGGGVWLTHHDVYHGLESQALPVPMQEGGVLLFNSLVFHGVGGNSSGEARPSITLAYRAADELERSPDSSYQIVVNGEQSYRGNDNRPALQVSPGQ